MSTTRELIYKISARGQADVLKAIRTIREEAAKQIGEEVAGVETVLKARRTGRSKALSEEQRYQRDAFRLMLASRNKEVGEARKAEEKKTKDAEREQKKRDKKAEAAAKKEEKRLEASLRYLEKIEDRKTREIEKREKERTRIAEREENKRMANIVRSYRQAEREAARAYTQQQRREERRARDVMFESRRFYKGLGNSFVEGGRNAFNIVGGVVSRGAQGVKQGLGIDSAFDISGIVSERVNVEKLLAGLQIEARGPGQKNYTFDVDRARKQIYDTARQTGFDVQDVAQAIDVYSSMGSGQKGVDSIYKIARQAKAMGASPTTIAKVRAQLDISTGQQGRAMNEDQKDEFIAMMSAMGKTGVFRGEEVARYSERLISSAAGSGMDLTKYGKHFMSFLNYAKTQRGSGAMTTTSAVSFFGDILKGASKLEKMGVEVFDKSGAQKNPFEVMINAIEKTGGNKTKLGKVFSFSRSGAAIMPFVDAYNQAEAKKKGSGRQAFQDILEGKGWMGAEGSKLTGRQLVAEMNQDADKAINSEANKMKMSIEQIRQNISNELAPALTKLSKHMPEFVDQVTGAIKFFKKVAGSDIVKSAVGFVGKHPELALTGVIASQVLPVGNIAKTMTSAIIGGLVNTVPGLGKTVAGKAVGSALGGVAAMGSTPVYVTGVAAGVSLGGGLGGAVGGLGGLGGVGKGAGLLGGIGAGGAVAGIAAAAALSYLAFREFESHPAKYNTEGGYRKRTAEDTKEIKEEQEKKEKQKQGTLDILDGNVPWSADGTAPDGTPLGLLDGLVDPTAGPTAPRKPRAKIEGEIVRDLLKETANSPTPKAGPLTGIVTPEGGYAGPRVFDAQGNPMKAEDALKMEGLQKQVTEAASNLENLNRQLRSFGANVPQLRNVPGR